MDRKIGILSFLAIVFIFGIYGSAWAGDGAKPMQNRCKNLPAPTSGGPIIDVEFIAFFDGKNTQEVVAVLKRPGHLPHLLHYKIDVTEAPKKRLCPIKDQEDNEHYSLKSILKNQEWVACETKVEEKFGLKGVPILLEKSIKINIEQGCKAEREATMISGTAQIQVVPSPPSQTEK